MTKFWQFFKLLIKRMVSADWKTAGAEFTVFGSSLGMIISDVTTGNFFALIKDIPDFWTPVMFFVVAIRSIISSNDKAIKNPVLPQIDGVLSTAPAGGVTGNNSEG